MTTIKAAIQRFEDAVRDDEMKGAAPPHDHADIAKELEEARAALEDMVVGAEDELNCAEEVLDSLSGDLFMQKMD